MKCFSCNHVNLNDSKFCNNCGEQISKEQTKTQNTSIQEKNTSQKTSTINQKPIPVSNQSNDDLLEKPDNLVSGWLVLLALNLILAPILNLVAFSAISEGINNISDPVFTNTGYYEYTAVERESLREILNFEIVSQLIFMCLNIAAIILFFQKKKSFKKFYIFLLIVSLVLIIIDSSWYISIFPEESFLSISLIQYLLYTIFWTPYLIYSKRSNETFINK